MNARDPIILTAFVICIAIFLIKIKEAFNDEFNIRLDEDGLKQKMGEQFLGETKLVDIVDISFKFDKRNEFDKLKQLPITVSNKSNNYSLYVDWDCSTLTDLGGKARRVARILPGMTTDLFQSQVFSTVNPKTTLKETITAEDMLQRKKDQEEYEIANKPLIDFKADKGKYEKFMKGLIELEFWLEISCRVFGPGRSLGGDRVNIPCKFILKKLPWQVGLPWNPK